MPSGNPVKEELNLLDELAPLVVARQEIAVNRIKDPQKEVLASRTFFQNLVAVFSQVRAAYDKEVSSAHRTREGSAAVLFSPEQHLTGPIATATFRYYVNYLEHHAATPIVIGLVGKERFKGELPDVNFQYLDLQALENRDSETFADLIKDLLHYKTITFVFGQYSNLIRQSPTHVTIGDATGSTQTTDEDVRQFLFEPSLESIVELFDRNIVALLLDQAKAENNLAQLGSQITAMEKADAAIKKRRKVLQLLAVDEKRAIQNKQQRERLTGLYLWLNT